MYFARNKSLKIGSAFLLIALPMLLMAQAKLPAIWIGESAPSLITSQANFPNNEFVVVQLCGLRERCLITNFYVNALKDSGIDISFYPVFDKTQESLRSLADRYDNYAIIEWGMHPTMVSANQAYLLDQEKETIYQGVFRDWTPDLFKAISSGSGNTSSWDTYFEQQVKNFPTSTGLFLQDKTIYPLNLSVEDLMAGTSRGKMITISPSIAALKLKKTPFQPNQVVGDLIASVNGNLALEESNLFQIKILNVDRVEQSPDPEFTVKWADLLLSLGPKYGIEVTNFNSLPYNTKYFSSPEIPIGLKPNQVINWLTSKGLEFEVVGKEKISILTIK
ncbi:MAG: hypothetical protein AAGH79_12490 [Bacteroidota bacterium]